MLIRAFSDRLPVEKQFKLLDHVFSCSCCRVEFLALKEVWVESRELAAALGELAADEGTKERLKDLASREIQRLKEASGKRYPAFWRRTIRPAVAMAGALLLLVAVIFLLRGPRETALERTSLPWRMDLIEPKGEVAGAELAFRWTSPTGVQSYRLEIFDRGLERIYESDLLAAPIHILPEKGRLHLRPGEVYFWKIVALFDGDQSLESDFAKFVIREKLKSKDPAP
ncbi:MAG: hypothetical protein AB1715_06025 [Acidobacteriota bacterium]